MTLMTLADLVAEQAVALVIGAATVVVAPKAGPRLAELGGDLSERTRAAVAARGGIHKSIAGGVQRLGQRRNEEIDEPATPVHVDIDPTSLLAGLSSANVVSNAPGRVRLRLHQIVGQAELAEQTASVLAAIDGVVEVHARPTTGSVVVRFDPVRYPSLESLLDGIATLAGGSQGFEIPG